MISRLTCSQGHRWEPSALSSAPLVCPQCGRPALPKSPAPPSAMDTDQTVDFQNDPTIDHPAPAPPLPSEVTQTMHFTPPPATPPRSGNSVAGVSAVAGRSLAGSSAGRQDATPLPPSAMPFTILRQHARGGLGLVNLARDKHIQREVALKQILPQHAENLTLQKRFLYEAQITGQLEHPSIVPVYCLGNDEHGNPYYVMRFVKGRTLDAIISDHHAAPNPIVFRELLRRFHAVCQAVAYAHSRGVIHRDLKPANIMIGDYGETLVLDWGLAKDIKNKTDPAFFTDDPTPPRGGSIAPGTTLASTHANTSELTMQGQIIGTPAYMAPEQAEGRTELHGPVTDIYALGGILYKILAGLSPTPPAGSMTGPGGGRRLNFVASPPPSTIKKDIHPLLEQICLRAMATDPAARYPRALELAQDIQRWLDEHPLVLRQPTATTKILSLLRANVIPLLIIILGLIAIIIALLLAAHGK